MMNKYLVQDCDDTLIKAFDLESDALRFIKAKGQNGDYHLLVDRIVGY